MDAYLPLGRPFNALARCVERPVGCEIANGLSVDDLSHGWLLRADAVFEEVRTSTSGAPVPGCRPRG